MFSYYWWVDDRISNYLNQTGIKMFLSKLSTMSLETRKCYFNPLSNYLSFIITLWLLKFELDFYLLVEICVDISLIFIFLYFLFVVHTRKKKRPCNIMCHVPWSFDNVKLQVNYGCSCSKILEKTDRFLIWVHYF